MDIADLLDLKLGTFVSQLIVRKSCTWIVPADGWYLITGVGGGASGGVASVSGGALATGGGAGRAGQKLVWLARGTVLTIMVGAPGDAPVITQGNFSDGNAGGETSITGDGLAMVLPGGLAGKAAHANSADHVLAGSGPAADPTGVDFFWPAGESGTCTLNYVSGNQGLASGGGGVFGGCSGDVTVDGVSASIYAFSAGAGADFDSGAVYASISGNRETCPGGPFGPSPENNDSTPIEAPTLSDGLATFGITLIGESRLLTLRAVAQATNFAPGWGGRKDAYIAGLFAGGGGLWGQSSSEPESAAGDFGAGSGGRVQWVYGFTGAPGSKGGVIIERVM